MGVVWRSACGSEKSMGNGGRRTRYPAPYLLALDFCHARWRISSILSGIRRECGLKPEIESPLLPHITLSAPFDLPCGGTIREILYAVKRAARNQPFLPFRINGWEQRQGVHGWIIAHQIEPSAALLRFRSILHKELSHVVQPSFSREFEDEEFWFHSTAVLNVPEDRCRRIWDSLSQKPSWSVHLPLSSFRVLVLRYGRVYGMYDLGLRRPLSPREGHLLSVNQSSLSRFRRSSEQVIRAPDPAHASRTHLLADTHFGHANIIRYCSRPFSFRRVEEMNRVILRNWNQTVGMQDRIYFLGDLCYGPQAKAPAYYRKRLRGKITWIRGNHDEGVEETIDWKVLEYDGIRLLLVHDPVPWKGRFDGWILHGHHHNNHLTTFPFFHPEERTVNLSVEVTGYRPVSLEEIVNLIRTQHTVCWTRNSLIPPQPL